MKIQDVDIDKVIPYANNPRNNDAGVTKVAASIEAFGWQYPIIVDKDMVIIAGHTRLKAARHLGMTKVPVRIATELDETKVLEFRLADNRTAEESSWADEELARELGKILEADGDLDATGFDGDQIEALLARALVEEQGQTDEDEIPELPDDSVSKPGDLWQLGNHLLLCGSATVLSDVETVLDGSLADMTFCDPPYNVDYAGGAVRKTDRRIENDNLGEGFEVFLYDACVNILTVTKGATYMCMSSSELHTLQRAFTKAGGHWSTFVIWAKDRFTLGRADYQRQYEPILYGWKDGVEHFWCGARDQGDIWNVKRPSKNELHPTMKPVALVERAIRNSSKSRDIVLDPFGGSGTTLIACEKMGRQARLLELDPKYVDVIIARWQKFTGKPAVLDGDGQSFDEIAVGREAQ